MKLSPAAQKALERFMQTAPADVVNTFSEEQLEAIQHFLNSQYWKRHPVDIRLSIPFVFTRLYLVFIAGADQRSSSRLKEERRQTPLWTATNILVSLFIVSVGWAIFFAGVLISQAKLPSINNNPFPTVYPLKPDQESCEESGRVWKEGECYDFDHNPNF